MIHAYNQAILEFYEALQFNQDIFPKLEKLIGYWKKWPGAYEDKYLSFGLFSEAGEVADTYAKYYRGDYDNKERKRRLAKELADVLFFVTALAAHEGMSIGHLADVLVTKLDRRYREGTIKGDGSER